MHRLPLRLPSTAKDSNLGIPDISTADANILKYYIAYSLIIQQQVKRQEVRQASGVG